MCGRFTMAIDADDLQTELALGQVPADWKPRYNVAPGQNVGVVTNPHSRDVTWMQWGLVPFWAKDPTIGNRLINARAESLDEKSSLNMLLRSADASSLRMAFTSGRNLRRGQNRLVLFITACEKGKRSFLQAYGKAGSPRMTLKASSSPAPSSPRWQMGLLPRYRPNAGHPKRGGQVGLAARGQSCSVESPFKACPG